VRRSAGADITWLETALDAEFSPVRQRRRRRVGWRSPAGDALPATLDVMNLGEFEPEVWIRGWHRHL
jgi:hypothetical protein